MEDVQKIFAAGANKIRQLKGWSQTKLASKIKGGKQGTVSGWLRGRTKFPLDRIPEFESVLEVGYEEILETGRQELEPTQEVETRLAALEAKLPALQTKATGSEKPNDIKKKIYDQHKDHHDVVDQFDPAGLSYEINRMLLKIEQKKRSKMEKIKRFILDELKEVEEELLEDGNQTKSAG